jgi:DNA-binding response OmpR family regulator
MARIAAILRRAADGTGVNGAARSITLNDLVIDTENHAALRAGVNVNLTKNEFNILALLASRSHRIWTRDEIIDRVKGDDFGGFDRAIDTHIKNIRAKLGTTKTNPKYIETVYGMGYRCVENE